MRVVLPDRPRPSRTKSRELPRLVANQFGERLFSIFFRTYTEKVWGMSCEEISADWAAQRIKGLDLWTPWRNALRRSIAPANQPASPDNRSSP